MRICYYIVHLLSCKIVACIYNLLPASASYLAVVVFRNLYARENLAGFRIFMFEVECNIP